MSDFLDSIRVTDEEKKKAISRIIFEVMHSSSILSLNEIFNITKEAEEKTYEDSQLEPQIRGKLNENEILVAYSLAKKIKISIMGSGRDSKKLFDYLELTLGSINEDNLLRFVNEAVKDLEATKKATPKAKWSLQVGKIFSRLEGRYPKEEPLQKEETAQKEKSSPKGKLGKRNNIIDLKDYKERVE